MYSNVLNRSKDKDLATRIDNQEGRIESEVGVWEMNHADLKATPHVRRRQKSAPGDRAALGFSREQRVQLHLPGPLADHFAFAVEVKTSGVGSGESGMGTGSYFPFLTIGPTTH